MNSLPAALRSSKRVAPALVLAVAAAALTACVPGTVGPTVRAAPGPNKTVAEFSADNSICTISARITARSQLVANGGLNADAQTMQQILDNAFSQCMIGRGDLIPSTVVTDTAPDSYDALVRAVQAELRRTGFSGGAVDGVYGPTTRSAILSFERSNGMASDPDVSPSLLASLRAAPDGRAPVASVSTRARPVTAVKAPAADSLVQPVSSPPTSSAPGSAPPAAAPAPAPAPGGLVAPVTTGVGQ